MASDCVLIAISNVWTLCRYIDSELKARIRFIVTLSVYTSRGLDLGGPIFHILILYEVTKA